MLHLIGSLETRKELFIADLNMKIKEVPNRRFDVIAKSLAQDECVAFSAFYAASEDVYRHSLVKNKGLKVESRVKFKDDSDQVEVSHYEPDEERYESLLIRIRRFCNQKDKIHFPKVINLMMRNEECFEEKDFLINAKDVFGGKGVNTINYGVSGKQYNEEALFELYIKGVMFHIDPEKDEQLSLVKSGFGLPIAQIMIRNAVMYKVRAILAIYSYLRQEIKSE